jgi:hypothetical protein
MIVNHVLARRKSCAVPQGADQSSLCEACDVVSSSSSSSTLATSTTSWSVDATTGDGATTTVAGSALTQHAGRLAVNSCACVCVCMHATQRCYRERGEEHNTIVVCMFACVTCVCRIDASCACTYAKLSVSAHTNKQTTTLFCAGEGACLSGLTGGYEHALRRLLEGSCDVAFVRTTTFARFCGGATKKSWCPSAGSSAVKAVPAADNFGAGTIPSQVFVVRETSLSTFMMRSLHYAVRALSTQPRFGLVCLAFGVWFFFRLR